VLHRRVQPGKKASYPSFALAELPGPFDSFCSALTATLFCALLGLYGILFSLVARTPTRALLAAFLFPALANVDMILLLPVGTGTPLLAFWLSALALLAGWLAVRRRPGLVSASVYLLSLHLVLVQLAALVARLLLPARSELLPVLTPAHLVLAPIRGATWRITGHEWEWVWIFVLYWIVLVVNFFCARHWAARHFDLLTGRTTWRNCSSKPLTTGAETEKLMETGAYL